MQLSNRQRYLFILILAFSYNAIYSIAFMKGLYYTIMKNGLALTHFQLGQLYSFYGLFSMFSYLAGAFLFSRIKTWKLIAASSFIIGILTLFLTRPLSYTVLLVIFGIIGFLLGSAYYPAHLEILHRLSRSGDQGKIYGFFFVFNSLCGIIFASIGFFISSLDFSDTILVRYLFLFFAILNLASSICTVIFLRKIPSEETGTLEHPFQQIFALTKNKQLWFVILIVFTLSV